MLMRRERFRTLYKNTNILIKSYDALQACLVKGRRVDSEEQ